MTLIESEQSKDIQLTQLVRGPFIFRFASYRKGEDAKLDLRSEDYIVSEITPEQAIFALCDGVGSSFYGNIGSQFLGETIINWLGNVPVPNNSDLIQGSTVDLWLEKLNNDLKKELDSKINLATSIIQNRKSTSQGALIQLAEKTQRDDFGTQSNFTGGIIWPKSAHFPNGLVLLFWLGNARIRIFNETEDLTKLTKWGSSPEQLKEVWSSKEGVVGHVYSYLTDFSKITTVIAYSDGMDGVEERIVPNIQGVNLESLTRQAQTIKDDDVSFLEIFLARNDVDEYTDDIVSKVRHQFNAVDNSILSESQSELQKLKRKLDEVTKEKNEQLLDLQKTKKNKKNLIIFILLLAISNCLLVMSYFFTEVPIGVQITSTNTSFVTHALIPPSSTQPINQIPINTLTATETATLTIPTITPSQTPTSTRPIP